MTEEPTPAPTPAPPASSAPLPETDARSYMQIWAESVASVLSQIAGAPFAVECRAEAPADTAPAEENDLRIVMVAGGALRGEMSLRIPRAAALRIAQLFLGEAQDPAAEFKPDTQEAVEELLRQVAGHAATALKPRWGEVQLRVDASAAPTWSAASSGWLISGPGAACSLRLEWQVSAALNAALVAASQAAESKTVDAAAVLGKGEGSLDAAAVLGRGEGNLDLLMDVELEITLRFGERTMLLRDILELGEGSVVELDREVEEPVDLLLDGKLIARGEVVVVDGNYGLRVREMLTPAASGS